MAEPAAKKARIGEEVELLKAKLLEPALHYVTMHGLIYADTDLSTDPTRATQCPVALLPGTLPKQAFDEVVALSPLWNKMVDNIARDVDWMYKTLEAACAADPFTGRLVQICKEVMSEGLRQKKYLGIHRSDYMLHEPDSQTTPRFLQVELNTIASSMGAHAFNAHAFHKYLLGRYGKSGKGSDDTAAALRTYYSMTGSAEELTDRLPENLTLKAIPSALARAHEAYGVKEAVVLMVVQGGERNFADQRWLEFNLWEQHKVPMIRKSLKEIHDEGVMDGQGKLTLNGVEISVCYFRAGYGPDCYPTEDEWKGRLLLERSMPIKCPSVAYQLVGTKKVQQALASHGVVERFLSADEASQLRRSFAGLWGLGPGEDDAEIIRTVQADPTLYVLKPQREGGGNNFYGAQVAEQFKTLSQEERGAYILMQRIVPKPRASVLTRMGKADVAECVSEYGFYSVFLGDGSKVPSFSEHAGHLVRTKMDGVDEGGVAAGYAVINSPFLVK